MKNKELIVIGQTIGDILFKHITHAIDLRNGKVVKINAMKKEVKE